MEEIKDEEIREEIIEEPEDESEDREKQEVSEEPEDESEDSTIDEINDRFERIEKAIEEISRRVSLFVESGAVISDSSEAVEDILEDDDFLVPADELVLKLG